jgi:hypothetical protein
VTLREGLCDLYWRTVIGLRWNLERLVSLMIEICVLTMFLLPVADIPAIPAEIEKEVRIAAFGEDQPVGFSKKDLSSCLFPLRMPCFLDWIEDAFRFEAEARRQGACFINAPGAAALLKEGWIAGGHALAPEEGPNPFDNAALEDIGITLATLWRHAEEEPPADAIDDVCRELSPKLVVPLARFLAALPLCFESWHKAVESVNVDEESLETQALGYYSAGGGKRAASLFEKQFDRAWAGRAAVTFVDAVETLAGEIIDAKLSARTADLRVPTPYGEILLGAKGKSEHGAERFLLLIDVSGNDRYLPGSACGSGDYPLSAVIDLRGNDIYESKGEPGQAGAGAGVGGVGIVVDVTGDDQYLAEQYGAGFAALGAGLVHDLKGDDRYVGSQVCQAVGLCGVGLILDEKGDDHYEIFLYGQGLGQPMGAGLLVDRAGNDTYVARDDELRHPSAQTAEHNVSMAQGCGLGLRDDENKCYLSGGLGLLLDQGGDDRYRGAVFAQAVGYWYGVGLLFDLEGQDSYEAVYYGQSASAHFALSYHLDVEGDDKYKTTLSQSLGNGRDLSLSVFRDEEGDDTYFAPDRSLGCGDLNGIGLFVDSDGKDTYTFQTAVNGGHANFAGTNWPESRQKLPTVGIFLDLGRDRDRYGREEMKNGGKRTSGGHFEGMKGFGMDDGP